MKYRWLLVFALMALLLSVPAWGEEAQEITAQCTFTVSPKAFRVERMTDRDWSTPNITETARNPCVEVTSPAPMYGVYVCFGTMLSAIVFVNRPTISDVPDSTMPFTMHLIILLAM